MLSREQRLNLALSNPRSPPSFAAAVAGREASVKCVVAPLV